MTANISAVTARFFLFNLQFVDDWNDKLFLSTQQSLSHANWCRWDWLHSIIFGFRSTGWEIDLQKNASQRSFVELGRNLDWNVKTSLELLQTSSLVQCDYVGKRRWVELNLKRKSIDEGFYEQFSASTRKPPTFFEFVSLLARITVRSTCLATFCLRSNINVS